MNYIDNFLNKITMYRLVLYALTILVAYGLLLSFFGFLPFSSFELICSIVIILGVSYTVNTLFAWGFKAPVNIESLYISAFILILIVSPSSTGTLSAYLFFTAYVAAIAMFSKFILAIGKKHIANPAAIALVVTLFTIDQSGSWWVGNVYMTPLLLVLGLLVVRKIRRSDLVISFLITVLLVASFSSIISGDFVSVVGILYKTLSQSSVLFLAFFMLTEPLTTPPTRMMRILYGALVGILFLPTIHIGQVYIVPELALVIGNIFSYIVSPKDKLILTLKERTLIANDTYEFVFAEDKKLSYKAGQYMEWTFSYDHPDMRGNRRYFTLASSPTEDTLKLGLKFYPNPSGFKSHLLTLPIGEVIVAAQCAGEFIMPHDISKKLVFIAGGIGVTPFRSMIKYCADTGEKRDITMLYSNKTVEDIAYKNIFEEAREKIGIKTLYVVTETKDKTLGQDMYSGSITKEMIQKEIPDYRERAFYISGPHGMVVAFQKTLSEMGISNSQIKTDFFPGFT